MLQSITPVVQNIARNPNVQRAAFAVMCGVGTVYTIRGAESARTSFGSWFSTKKENMAIRKQQRTAVKAAAAMESAVKNEEANVEPMVVDVVPDEAKEVRVTATIQDVAEAHFEDVEVPVAHEGLEEAVSVVIYGASFNELRTKASQLGLKFEKAPDKRMLAKAIVLSNFEALGA